MDDEVRTVEVTASLCLATDLAMGLPLEHGLHSALIAARLAERLGVDQDTARQSFYGSLLFYAGCTADAEISAEIFEDGALLTHFNPVMFASPPRLVLGILRALAGENGAVPVRAARAAVRFPGAARGHQRHVVAMCEVAKMLSDRLGMPASVSGLFDAFTKRWDDQGHPGVSGGLPLALRIVHVARDAELQLLVTGNPRDAVDVLRSRAGGAFDPDVVGALAEEAEAVLVADDSSCWDRVLAAEPGPPLSLRGEEVDRALSAMGDFADLVSPFLVGHSSGVAGLADDAARHCGLPATEVAQVRRAAMVHDVGRVAVSPRVWQKPGPLTPDQLEQVRLHAYHSERVLRRSGLLAAHAAIAGTHHERLDGSGYHRQVPAPALGPQARILAAADAYHAMTELRPHRPPLSREEAARQLMEEADAGRLDRSSVAAVLEAAGHRRPHLAGPAGLTEREIEVVVLVARGLPTKRVGRALGISVKTADRHIQNAYSKMGVSSRAAAAVFAMQHGLTSWGELPIPPPAERF